MLYGNKKTTDVVEINNIVSDINADEYKVYMSYDSDGFVNGISIGEVKK